MPHAAPPLFPYLRQLIERNGPLTLAEYMAIVLGHPEHGYYRTRDPLGAAGDFFTAPEISQMFGELIGLWCVTMWQNLGSPPHFNLVELGPGRGTLMADLLKTARIVPDFLAAMNLCLVETSPVLQAKQQERVSAYKPVFYRSFDEIPDLPLILIANEFFDTLPIRQFRVTGKGLSEHCVGFDPETNQLQLMRSQDLLPYTGHLPPDAMLELCPSGQALICAIARKIVSVTGAALIIDYGYESPTGHPTLQALRQHKSIDPLLDPGTADVTAHVDFGGLKEGAERENAYVFGPVPQGAFLKALGIDLRAKKLGSQTASAYHRLTDPAEMGVLFKALAVTSFTDVPPGFELITPKSKSSVSTDIVLDDKKCD